MARRNREIQIFSLSFLDAICCALGAVLLLLLYSITAAKEESEHLTRQKDEVTRLANSLRDSLHDEQERARQAQEEGERTLRGLESEQTRRGAAEQQAGEYKIAWEGEKALRAGLEGQNEKLRGQLEQEQRERQNAERNARKYEDELGKAQVDLNEVRDQLAAAEAESDRLKKGLDADMQKLADAVKQGGLLKSEIERLKNTQGKTQADLDRRNKELAEKEQEIADLQGKVANGAARLDGASRDMRDWRSKYDGLVRQIEDFRGQIARARSERDAFLEELRTVRDSLRGVVMLKGELKNVVFVCDTSASLKDDERLFREYVDLLKAWITTLPMEELAIVRFSSTVQPHAPEFLPASTKIRAGGVEFVSRFVPDGRTVTKDALQAALAYPGVDTIVLFTDGEPTDVTTGIAYTEPQMREIESWLLAETNRIEQQTGQPIVINTVAVGARYFNRSYGPFLQRIADAHGGVFIGR